MFLIEFQEAFWDHSTFDFSSFRKKLFSLLTEKLSRHQLTKDQKLIDEMKFQWWMFVLLTSEDVGRLTARIIGCDIFLLLSIYVDLDCLSKSFLVYWPFSKKLSDENLEHNIFESYFMATWHYDLFLADWRLFSVPSDDENSFQNYPSTKSKEVPSTYIPSHLWHLPHTQSQRAIWTNNKLLTWNQLLLTFFANQFTPRKLRNRSIANRREGKKFPTLESHFRF